MLRISLDDTIAAIATPIGEGGIGIVRLSGKQALSIADEIFTSKDGKKASGYGTHTTHYGWIMKDTAEHREPSTENRNIIDEVILTVMHAPKTYTKEDVVEINCHGGIVPLKKVLELVLNRGARLAEPGEFTKRAFLNGRIDLIQAEAVLDVVRTKTRKGLDIALLQLEGNLSKSIADLKNKLMDIKVHLEATVDFPDEGLSTYSAKEISVKLHAIKADLEGFIKSFDSGKIIREGISSVICGKPNAGKSSLMNELLSEERVIVTPVPGTTRDAICEYVNVGGVSLNIVDTAGITETKDPVEKEGVIRSRLWIDKSDLVLFVMDAGTGFTDEDRYIIDVIKQKEVICIVNKIDLNNPSVCREEARKHFGKDIPFVEISLLKKMNLDILIKAITDAVWKGKAFANDYNILTNARHKDSFSKTLDFVNEAILSLNKGQSEDIIAISINEAILSLGEVTGESISQEALNRIFEQFCVGK